MKVLYQAHGLINDNYKTFFKSQLPSDIELIFPDDNTSETLEQLASKADIFVGYSVTETFRIIALPCQAQEPGVIPHSIQLYAYARRENSRYQAMRLPTTER